MQAEIHLQIDEIVVTQLSRDAIPHVLQGNLSAIYYHPNFDENKINLFFVRNLHAINGIALFQINTAMVADITTVNDYRTTAHEIGHLLGLQHVGPPEMLMARGRNGELLSFSEINTARETALGITLIFLH